MPGEPSLSETTRRALVEGCRRFDAGRFFDAHEVWEDAWRVETGPVRLLLQGLIQIAAGFHKGLAQDVPAGMVRLLDAGLAKLDLVGGLGLLELATFRDEVVRAREAARRWAETGERPDVRSPRLGRPEE
jgi:uncharacterized protein